MSNMDILGRGPSRVLGAADIGARWNRFVAMRLGMLHLTEDEQPADDPFRQVTFETAETSSQEGLTHANYVGWLAAGTEAQVRGVSTE